MYTTKQVASIVNMDVNSVRVLMRKMGIPHAKTYDQSVIDRINKRNQIRSKRKEYVTYWSYIHPDLIPVFKEFTERMVKEYEEKL